MIELAFRQSLMVLSTTDTFYMQSTYLPFIGVSLFLFAHCLPFEHRFKLGHQNVGFCEVSYTYLLRCLRYGEKHAKYILISCGCMLLFTNM